MAAFERIFGATIFFGADTLTGRASMVQCCRFNFMREAQIWYSRVPDQRALSSDFENVIGSAMILPGTRLVPRAG